MSVEHTSIRSSFLILFFIIGSCSAAFCEQSDFCAGLREASPGVYLHIPLENITTFAFFGDATLQIKSHLSLSEQGVVENGKIICKWKPQDVNPPITANRILENCPTSQPFVSGWGDGGVGTAILCLHATQIDNNKGYVNYNSEKLYFFVPKGATWEEVVGKCDVGC